MLVYSKEVGVDRCCNNNSSQKEIIPPLQVSQRSLIVIIPFHFRTPGPLHCSFAENVSNFVSLGELTWYSINRKRTSESCSLNLKEHGQSPSYQ